MNTKLESLFEKYRVSDKDRYEINQIYGLLPIDKKRNLINNFEGLAFKLDEIAHNIEAEREILLPNSIKKIKDILIEVRTERLNLTN